MTKVVLIHGRSRASASRPLNSRHLQENAFQTDFFDIFLRDWIEFVIEEAISHTTSREFYHKITKLRVRFDPKKEGAPGFEGKDHWHIRNPNATGKQDRYLDKNGNPVRKGADESHIIPKKDGDD